MSEQIPQPRFQCDQWVVVSVKSPYGPAWSRCLKDLNHEGKCEPGQSAHDNSGDRVKETNPKDAVGIAKVPFSTVPAQVVAEVGLAMLEGARKYGRYNYRVAGVKASVYYDGNFRHMTGWWEGQDIDPDSGLNHITKAIADLTVLRDAMINGLWVDDRPPKVKDQDWIAKLNLDAKGIIERYPDPKEPFTEINKGDRKP